MSDLPRELKEAGFRAKRSLGQNFIFDANFLEMMVREAGLEANDVVVEFGTGPGQLTERLAARAAHVVTAEIDPRLHEFSSKRRPLPNVDYFFGDAIPGGDELNPELRKLVASRSTGRRLRVVSNFPYAVAGSILVALAEGQLPAEDAVGTIQLEVAHRLTAGPSTESYGPLGILLQRLASIELLRTVPPQLFWPQPEVDSALIRVRFHRAPFEGDWQAFKTFVKSVFGFRRKTLAAGLKKMGCTWSGPRARQRPEELSPRELEEVWRTLSSKPRA